jgi:hypothetical protein
MERRKEMNEQERKKKKYKIKEFYDVTNRVV